jgi:hypothetical protein
LVYIVNLFILAPSLQSKHIKKDKKVNSLSIQNNLGNYLFVACMFAGIALGMMFNSVSGGTLLGMAVGFAAYGLALLKQKKQS